MGDWLEIEAPAEKAGLPAVVSIPDDYPARLALVEECWSRLTAKQKLFLSAWRDCRFNQRAAVRQLGLSENAKPNTAGMQNPDYATVVRIWRANAAANALDKDRLLARHDDIVEQLLEPKPILHQGVATGYEENEAGAAARANETLMQAAGIIKSGKESEVNVNVGIVGPALNIQVMPMPPSRSTESVGVQVDLPVIDAEFESVEEDWLGGP